MKKEMGEGGMEGGMEGGGEEGFPPRRLLGPVSEMLSAAAAASVARTEGGGEVGREVPLQAARHIADLLLFLCQTSPRVRLDMVIQGEGGREEEVVEDEDSKMDVDTPPSSSSSLPSSSLIENVMDLLAAPHYTASTARLDGVLTLLETVLVTTLASYLTPEEKLRKKRKDERKKEKERKKKKEEEEAAAAKAVAAAAEKAEAEAAAAAKEEGGGEGGADAKADAKDGSTTAAAPPAPPAPPAEAKAEEAGAPAAPPSDAAAAAAAAEPKGDSLFATVEVPGLVLGPLRLQRLCGVFLEESCSDTTFYRVNKIAGALSRVPANRVHLLQVRFPSLLPLFPSFPLPLFFPYRVGRRHDHRCAFLPSSYSSSLPHLPPFPPSLLPPGTSVRGRRARCHRSG
jgi:hypothetical protein